MLRPIIFCGITPILIVLGFQQSFAGPAADHASQGDAARTPPLRHYIFFNLDRDRIREPSFAESPDFEGAQLKYTWRELEPEPGVYRFDDIERDLVYLQGRGKRLFVQLQDVSFGPKIVNVPEYLRTDPAYHGGADPQYAIPGDDESRAKIEGWVARRWDPVVRERYHALLRALGKRFDGRIEGIVIPETSVEFGHSGALFPAGFDPASYREGILENMRALRSAFGRSVAMIYANFMPGEWLPWTDAGHLETVYRTACDLGIAVGGPDCLPYKKGQMNHAYRFMRSCRDRVPIGVAVQWNNYKHIDPRTHRRSGVTGLMAFASEYLGSTYMFWCTQEPFYTAELIPHLEANRD